MSGVDEKLGARDAVRAMYRVSFSAFAELTPRLLGEGPDWQAHWSSRVAAIHVERCLGRSRGRLVVNAPPYAEARGHISVALPAWLTGRWPNFRVSCVSRSRGHADLWREQIERVLEHPFYRYLFPSRSVETQRRALQTRSGGCVSTTVVGQHPGVRSHSGNTQPGCDVLIIDTPDALDHGARASQFTKTVRWYETIARPALRSREHGRVILLTPRVHQDDLSACLLRESGCRGLTLRSIATENERLPFELGDRIVRRPGDVLQPDNHSAEVLQRVFKDIGEKVFDVQHQQNPPDPSVRDFITGLRPLGELMREIQAEEAFNRLLSGEQSS